MDASITQFWALIDLQLVSELLAVFIAAFWIGFALGFKLYAFRRIISSAT